MGASQKFTDVIVVVHGIGEQIRFSTVRYVATRLAGSKTLLAGAGVLPVSTQPLGYFHSDVQGLTSVRLVDDDKSLPKMPLTSIGFAEVFWADIPEQVVKQGDTLEETKAWARTVVARARALCLRARIKKSQIIPPDFGLAAEVLDEVIETVYVLENLFFLADKAGLFKFNLRRLLENYLGDVQIVTEFSSHRTDIVGRFHRAMEDIYEMQCREGNDKVRLHIVAHSEGTVVSFLGLLYAMSGTRMIPAGPTGSGSPPEMKEKKRVPEWLKRVHGFMTIGSPIDKHLLLWPRIWDTLNPSFADASLDVGQIKWRNYYDYGDPIGFKLDTTRRWLDLHKLRSFEFCGCPKCHHDIGFARYLLPGKAHNDYWDDPAVFEHFVDDVITPAPGVSAKPPADKRSVLWISPTFPYLLSFLMLFVGVFILYKGVSRFIYSIEEPLELSFIYSAIGVRLSPEESAHRFLLNTLGFSLLIAGTTLFARIPRLAATLRWKGWGWSAFVIGAALYACLVSEPTRDEIGAVFGALHPYAATAGVVLLALMVAILGFLMTRPTRQRGEDRRQRWFFKGTRPLIISGALAVALLVGSELYPTLFGLGVRLTGAQRALLSVPEARIVEDSVLRGKEIRQLFLQEPEKLRNLQKVEPILTRRPPVWPVFLAGAGYLYLWWLATLIFDLAFVWQRYVRRSVANDRLSEWEPFGLPPAREPGKPETCRSASQG
jgi:hypothetical protein